jgi:hypothetical protein
MVCNRENVLEQLRELAVMTASLIASLEKNPRALSNAALEAALESIDESASTALALCPGGL